jgi:hypothetical protein
VSRQLLCPCWLMRLAFGGPKALDDVRTNADEHLVVCFAEQPLEILCNYVVLESEKLLYDSLDGTYAPLEQPVISIMFLPIPVFRQQPHPLIGRHQSRQPVTILRFRQVDGVVFVLKAFPEPQAISSLRTIDGEGLKDSVENRTVLVWSHSDQILRRQIQGLQGCGDFGSHDSYGKR